MRGVRLVLLGAMALQTLALAPARGLAALTGNAHVDVAKVKLGLGWVVTDDKFGGPTRYFTVITVTLPEGVEASVSKKAPNETVVLKRSTKLTCGPDGIEANVTYHVTATKPGSGTRVAVKVAKVAGQKPAATGDILGKGTGRVGHDISLRVVIRGPCP